MKRLLIVVLLSMFSFSLFAADKTYKDDIPILTSLSGKSVAGIPAFLKEQKILTYNISQNGEILTLSYFRNEDIKYSIVYNDKNIIGTKIAITYNPYLLKKQDQNQASFYKEDLEGYLTANGWEPVDFLPEFMQPEITYKKGTNYIIFSSDNKLALNLKLANDDFNEVLEDSEDKMKTKLKDMSDAQRLEVYKKIIIIK